MVDPKAAEQFRTEQGWTKTEMAKRLGMSLNAYSAYSRGRTDSMEPGNEKKLRGLLGEAGYSTGATAPSAKAARIWSGVAADLRRAAELFDDTGFSSDYKNRELGLLLALLQSRAKDIPVELGRTE